MKNLCYLAAESLSALLPFFLLLLFQRRHKTAPRSRYAVLLALYFTAVFHLTGAGTLWDWIRYGIEIRADTLNLLPFSRVSTLDSVRGCLLNVLMTLPLGILIPLAWPEKRRLRTPLVTGFLCSLLVELSQLMNHRRTDVDDLICNTLGACLGYGLFLLWQWLTGPKKTADLPRRLGPMAYLLASFLGRFLLFDALGLAGWLYGF